MDGAQAFEAFYQRSYASVSSAVRVTVGDRDLARDAVDEAFVRAAERWPSVRDTRRPAAWTYRVAVNWAISWRRKLRLRPVRPAEVLDRPYHDEVPDLDLARSLAVLTLEHRQLLVLRLAFELSVKEVAETLGMPEGTVKSGLHRAKRRLQEEQEVLDGHHR